MPVERRPPGRRPERDREVASPSSVGSTHPRLDTAAFAPKLSGVSSVPTPGARFRAALAAERPLQIAGAINAYAALLAQRAGFSALYLSGAGVANHSYGIP